MDALDLSRWQFGITTVYHFILVPIAVGLSPLVAIMQARWLRTGDNRWLRLSEFFGKLLIISFALGVATGIVQEFQFGMNWSEYSKFVGDIFGAPLAFEALLAFFLESVFLGIWIFGRGRISPKAHTAAISLMALGTNISAWFILAANSFMQDPRGAVFNPETGRAELDGMSGFLKVVFSPTTIFTLLHTIAAALMVAGAFISGVAIWWMVRSIAADRQMEANDLWKRAARFGLKVLTGAGVLAIATGHFMGQHMYNIQPTKMISAMGVPKSGEGHSLALMLTGTDLTEGNIVKLPIPGLESLMATNHLSGPDSYLMGADEIQQRFTDTFSGIYGEGVNYLPNVFVTFYSFRIMIGLGMLSVLLGVIGLYLLRGDKLIKSTGIAKLYAYTVPAPFLAATFGWILTEMGRQPWVVYPSFERQDSMAPGEMIQLLTHDGVSQNVLSLEVLISMLAFTLLYAALGVVWYKLIIRYVREGINPEEKLILEGGHTTKVDDDTKLSFAY